MRARVLAATLLTATALTLAGCGTDTGDTASTGPAADSNTTASGTPADTATAPAAVPAALRFTATTTDGKPFDGATLTGKPTVLWFWAPWCPTCRGQAAETAKVADQFEGKAHVIGVAGLDEQAAMKDFVTSTKISAFPNLSDEPGDIWKKFEITQQSTYVLLDKDGKTVFTGVLPGGQGLADKLAELTG
ncbi:redoxin domain-containing protein [Streptomyces sp. NPDC050803]|uniref:redoxin domain-containing protein n=1 Tax=unclassified Streptomyces TaxID=2593676 RepID=UPI003445BF97